MECGSRYASPIRVAIRPANRIDFLHHSSSNNSPFFLASSASLSAPARAISPFTVNFPSSRPGESLFSTRPFNSNALDTAPRKSKVILRPLASAMQAYVQNLSPIMPSSSASLSNRSAKSLLTATTGTVSFDMMSQIMSSPVLSASRRKGLMSSIHSRPIPERSLAHFSPEIIRYPSGISISSSRTPGPSLNRVKISW